MVDPPQQHHLDENADRRDDQRRDNDAAPKTDGAGKSLGERERDVSAQHIERAVGEIDDPRDAENDRQARRHQKQRGRAGKTGQELNDVKGHWRSALAQFSVHWLHPSRRRFAPPQDEVLTLMVRSAATPRVSNHAATGYAVMIRPNPNTLLRAAGTHAPAAQNLTLSDAALRLRHRWADSRSPCGRPNPP